MFYARAPDWRGRWAQGWPWFTQHTRLGPDSQDFADQGWRVKLRTRVHETIAELQRETTAAGEIVIEPGEPHNVVPDAAGRTNADLIVIGRGVRTSALGRLRAHSYEIIRNAPCPVLSV